MKQKELAKWLKGIIVVCAFIGLLLCTIIAPVFGKEAASSNPELVFLYLPCLLFIWITAIPFYIALWNSWLICSQIESENCFCIENANRLKTISRLAILECLLYLLSIIILTAINIYHPSILLLALFVIFIGISIAVITAALSCFTEKASKLKQDSDLTI